MSITVGHSFQDRPTQYLTLLLCPDLRQPQIHLTMEQLQILSHNMQLQDVIKIVAFAGACSLPSLHSWPCASCKMSCSFCKSFMTLLMIRFCFFLFVPRRHGQNHHAGEVRRAAATPPLPVRGLQQVGGQRGAAPLPQQRDQQDRPLVGLCRHRQEVSALASVFKGDFKKKANGLLKPRRRRKN